MPKTVAIIQARMGSSRLPGKVLLEIAGKPMIQHVIERTRRAQTVDLVAIATTTDPADDPVAAFAVSMGIPYTRGSLHDVLDRYYQAAQVHQADVVVRVTADCPVVDPLLIDQTVELLSQPGQTPADFSCNRLPPPFGRSIPIGLDIETCTFAALQRAWREADAAFHREHVLPFLYEGTHFTDRLPHPRVAALSVARGLSQRHFQIAQLHHQPDHGGQRWTVDTPEDLSFIRQVFARLEGRPDFNWYDVLEIVQKDPGLSAINQHVQHKQMTDVDPRTTH